MSENLTDVRSGIHLSTNHAKMVWQDNKSLIVKDKKFDDAVGSLYYVLGGNEAYGIVKINKIDLISINEFDKLVDQHRITDDERKEWFGNKKKLYAYYFEKVKVFDAPILVDVPEGSDFLIQDLKFVSDLVNREKELLEMFSNYEPTKIKINQLKDDFRITLSWYCNKVSGDQMIASMEEIDALFCSIIKELINRGDTVFNSDKMEPLARDIFNQCYGVVIGKPTNCDCNTINGLMSDKKDLVVAKNAVAIKGSSLNFSDYDNLDLLISLEAASDKVKRNIEFNLMKLFPEKLSDKINFIWGEVNDSGASYVSLYDFVLKKSSCVSVVDSNKPKVSLFKPFKFMEISKKFNDANELSDYLYG